MRTRRRPRLIASRVCVDSPPCVHQTATTSPGNAPGRGNLASTRTQDQQRPGQNGKCRPRAPAPLPAAGTWRRPERRTGGGRGRYPHVNARWPPHPRCPHARDARRLARHLVPGLLDLGADGSGRWAVDPAWRGHHQERHRPGPRPAGTRGDGRLLLCGGRCSRQGWPNWRSVANIGVFLSYGAVVPWLRQAPGSWGLTSVAANIVLMFLLALPVSVDLSA